MALVKGRIKNLLGGISQQSPTARLPTQASDDVNVYPVIVDGLTRRPPSEHVAKLPTQIPTTALVHAINRDANERYVVSIHNGAITITDLAGNAKTVSYPHGTGYLSVPAGTEASNLQLYTLADYTFVLNRTKTVAMSSEVFPLRRPEALVNVINGNYGKTYEIAVNGSVVATYTTNNGGVASDSTSIDTTNIATELYNDLTANLTAPDWTVTQYSNVVHFYRPNDYTDFTIASKDGYSNHAMKVNKTQVQYFTDLPLTAPDGFVCGVVGDTTAPNQFYYVQFKSDGSGVPTAGTTTTTTLVAVWNGVTWVWVPVTTTTSSAAASASGAWRECPKPGVEIAFDAATMPHILVRNEDGSFTFQKAEWDKRVAGDDEVAPRPSFVGKKIMDMGLFQNRFGLFTDSNVVFSRAGDYFNFWRTTALDVLDSDLIDINAATTQVAFLRASVEYQNALTIWSDQLQFVFSGGDLLTPKTASMSSPSDYANLSGSCRPVSNGRRITFAFDRGGFSGLKEWYYDTEYRVSSADEITAHVPTLIPTGVSRLRVCSTEDVLVVATNSDRSNLWVYKYLWDGQNKVQASWVRWEFPGATIISHFVINSTLYILANRGTETRLEALRLLPALSDDGAPVVYLDGRIHSSDVVNGGYDSVMDTTSYTLPFTPDADTLVAYVGAGTAAAPLYTQVPIASIAGAVVKTVGDTEDLPIYFGTRFTSLHVFSPIYYRDSTANEVIQEGRLQLLKGYLSYQNTGYFRVQVTPDGRPSYSYEVSPLTIGDAAMDIDTTWELATGVTTFPILSNSERVDIRVINDTPMPSSFTRLEWKGNFVPKTRR